MKFSEVLILRGKLQIVNNKNCNITVLTLNRGSPKTVLVLKIYIQITTFLIVL